MFCVLVLAHIPARTRTHMDSQLIGLLRKLCMTGLVVFVQPGTVTQAFFALISALFFLLMVMRYLPYEEEALDRTETQWKKFGFPPEFTKD